MALLPTRLATRTLAALSFALCTLPLAAQTVTSGITLETSLGLPQANGSLSVYQEAAVNPGTGVRDSTSVFIDWAAGPRPTEGTLIAVMTSLDEGSEWALAQAGQTFSADTVAAGAFTWFASAASTPFPNTVNVPRDFYLAVRTRAHSDDFQVNLPVDVYGWARLSLSAQGTLTLVDEAVAYGAAGIVVGTRQAIAVPEAGTSASLLLGLGLIGAALRRSRSTVRNATHA